MDETFEEVAELGHQRRTKYEIEAAIYTNFDIHKKDRNGIPYAPCTESDTEKNWLYKVDDFLEREKYHNFRYYLHQ